MIFLNTCIPNISDTFAHLLYDVCVCIHHVNEFQRKPPPLKENNANAQAKSAVQRFLNSILHSSSPCEAWCISYAHAVPMLYTSVHLSV